MSPEMNKLRRICRKWGGDLLKVSKSEYDRLFKSDEPYFTRSHTVAPFSGSDLGVDWPGRKVIYVDDDVPWSDVIHEMGHVFAADGHPDHTDEYDFFGWEYLLAKMVGDPLEWVRGNKDYQVLNGEGFGLLPSRKRDKILAERIQVGKNLGIIDAKGRPLCRPREFSVQRFYKILHDNFETHHTRAKLLREAPVLNGNAFEDRCEKQGFAEGYEQAMRDAIHLLHSMVDSSQARTS